VPLPSSASEDDSFKPRAVQMLIFTNIVVFAYQLYATYHQGQSPTSLYGAIPSQIMHENLLLPRVPNLFHKTLFTSLFLHDVRIVQGGFLHLIGNMLYLSAFGPNLERLIGSFRFLFLYLLCGFVATLSYVSLHHASSYPLIGASGAIAGIMGAHLVACPKSKIRCLVLIYPVEWSAFVLLLPWIALQLINASLSSAGAPIAWLTHIVGFVAGMSVIGKLQPPRIEAKQAVQKFRLYY